MRKRFFTYLTIICILPVQLIAQLTVDANIDEAQIAQLLKRQGISVLDITVDCPDGSYGSFAGTSNAGLADGLILSNGDIIEAIGPNDSGIATGSNTGHAGSTLLDNLTTVNGTTDACIITMEFDSGCAGTIDFRFVFGSEEYFQTVNPVADVFAMILNGPGIGADENIALLPSGEPVTTQTVSDTNNTTEFINNGDGSSAPQNTDPAVLQYDGFTTVLTASATLVDNSNYTLQFIIADDLDGGLDSGVFIENGNVVEPFSFNGQTSTVAGFNGMVEDCSDATIQIEIENPDPMDQTLELQISGTATNGTDYVDSQTGNALSTMITIPANSSTFDINLSASADGSLEGTETVLLEILDVCGVVIDSITVEITDAPVVEITPADAVLCNDEDVQLETIGADSFSWTPTIGLSCADCPNPIASPDSTTTYIVTGTIGGTCSGTDTITVQVFSTASNAGEDQSLCDENDFVTIGPEFPSSNLNYQWTDQLGQLVSTQPNITVDASSFAGPNSSALYTLEVSDQTGTCSATDQVSVIFTGPPSVLAQTEQDTIFAGESVLISALGAGADGTYIWTADGQGASTANINDAFNASTFVRPEETTDFIVEATTAEGCVGFDTLRIFVEPQPLIHMPNAFSPNADGQNDLFRPMYVLIEELITFRIYNRWGVLMYENTGDFADGWDGEYKGVKQPVGSYTWYIRAKGINLEGDIEQSGNLTLIR